MAVIPRLIARYAVVLYALAALGVLFYIWAAIQARRKRNLALFALEREAATDQGIRYWFMAGACVLLILGIFAIGSFVVPNLPLAPADTTPEISLLFTPTTHPTPAPPPASPAVATATRASVSTVVAIATPLDRVPNTPVPTENTEDSPALAAACTSAGTQVVSPSNGDHLSGVVQVLGTANLPDFSFYKFEIQWPDTEAWVTLQSFDIPIAGGVLGSWDTTPLAGQPGNYRFRLVVVDNTGNFPDPCIISVVIE